MFPYQNPNLPSQADKSLFAEIRKHCPELIGQDDNGLFILRRDHPERWEACIARLSAPART